MPTIDKYLDRLDEVFTDPAPPVGNGTPVGISPLRNVLGVYSLQMGILIICFGHVLFNVIILLNISSVETIQISGISIKPGMQVIAGSWALLGMPLIVLGGMGSMFRVPLGLQLYLVYMIGSFFIDTFVTLRILAESDICASVVPKSIRRLGTQFICGWAETMVFVALLVSATFAIYCIWVVWSTLQEVSAEGPRLLKYAKKDEQAEDDEDESEKLSKPVGASPPSGYGGYGAAMPSGRGAPAGFAPAPNGFAPAPNGYGAGGGFATGPGSFAPAAGGYPASLAGGGYGQF